MEFSCENCDETSFSFTIAVAFLCCHDSRGIYYHLLLCITQSTCHSRCCLLSLVFKSFPIRFITSSSRPQNHWVAKKCRSLHFLRLVCACLCNLGSKQSSIFLLLCQCPSETRHASPINQVLVTIWPRLSLMWLNRRWKHETLASILRTLTRNKNDIEKAWSNTASTTVINDTVLLSVSDCQASPRLIPPASSAVLSAPHWLSLFNSRRKIWGPQCGTSRNMKRGS